jgi:uncharacterized UPF0146 family protein
MKSALVKLFFRNTKPFAPVADVLLSPLTLIGIIWFRIIRYWGIRNLPIAKSLFLKFGLIPIVDHYYEPLIDYRRLPKKNPITNLNLREEAQLEFIRQFNYQSELIEIPREKHKENRYYFHNQSFSAGDAELYYSIIRYYKPKKIIEVGSGFSTLLALEAIRKTKEEDGSFDCALTCIEPFEMRFLESLNVTLVRELIENVNLSIFNTLIAGDVLFIDSSHIIRPGGDVSYLILEVLPKLPIGVFVHFHDIFIPRHYPADWLQNEYRLWNEQYLLEAFLLGNKAFEVICSFNHLFATHKEDVLSIFPVLKEGSGSVGSFWLKKIAAS